LSLIVGLKIELFLYQLFNQNGSICNYSEFLSKAWISFYSKRTIVADAVAQGVLMLFKGFAFSSLSLSGTV